MHDLGKVRFESLYTFHLKKFYSVGWNDSTVSKVLALSVAKLGDL